MAFVFRNNHSKNYTWARTPISNPLPYCELAVSRTKRGGVEEIVISHVSLASLGWSVPPPSETLPHSCDQYLHLQNANVDVHTPTFHPLSNKEALGNIWMDAQSLLFVHPRGVSPVWCWAGDWQFTPCGTSSVSFLSGVCSSRVVVVHLTCFMYTTIQGEVPYVGAMKKGQFWWRTRKHPVYWFFTR